MTTSLDSIEQLVNDLSRESADIGTVPHDDVRSGPNTDSGETRPRGYRVAAKDLAPWPPAGCSGPGLQPPKPLPKRPKGRFIIGAILFIVCAFVSWCVWDSFLSVAAFGVVKADTLRITAPYDSRITQLHAREGQSVQQGEPLFTLESPTLRRQLARLQDELHVEQAHLDSESIRIEQESQEYTAEYYALWARLQKHREELTRLQRDLKRVLALDDPNIISAEEIDRKRFAESGQRALVEKLTEALEELRKRADANPEAEVQATERRLRPIRAKIDYLNAEIARVQEEIQEGDVVAPVNGTVVRCFAASGQQVTQSETILEIVDSDSLMIELFVPQRKTHELHTGNTVDVAIEPFSQSIPCTVLGARDCYELAPDSIRRYYRSGETLMPLMLKPDHAMTSILLRSGAVVRLKLWQHVANTWHTNAIHELWNRLFPPTEQHATTNHRTRSWPRVRTLGSLLMIPEGEPS